MNDPIEEIIATALTDAGIDFITPDEERYPIGDQTKGLDFYLSSYDVHIECKQFHTDRSANQLKRSGNIILIQGTKAARLFASLKFPLQESQPESSPSLPSDKPSTHPQESTDASK